MKSFKFLVLVGFIFMLKPVLAQQVIVTDDPTYTTPASGAMLDVKSTSKGFMPPRVALTGRTDATTITTPETGLMIFNTSNAGTATDTVSVGYYYNSGTVGSPVWEKLLNSDVSNGLSFTSDGSPILNGDASNWDDLRVPLSQPAIGTTIPNWDQYPYGITGSYPFLNWFKATGIDEMYFVVQMPHSWKVGSTIMPHIHWTPSQTSSGAVRWGLQYIWLNIGDDYTSYTTIYGSTPILSTDLVQSKHYLTPLGADGIDGTGKKISSMLICRIFRDGSNSADTYAGLAGAFEVDFHYEINTFGSREEFVK